jgi:hypothetical protein
MKKVDMSGAAITRRLRQADQLRELSLSLMKARPLTPEETEAFRKERAENAAKRNEKR